MGPDAAMNSQNQTKTSEYARMVLHALLKNHLYIDVLLDRVFSHQHIGKYILKA